MLCLEQFVVGLGELFYTVYGTVCSVSGGSYSLLFVGQFGVGFWRECVCCVWDILVSVWRSEFVLCVGLFLVGLWECVCAVCGTVCEGLGE